MFTRLFHLATRHAPVVRDTLAHWRANLPADCPLCASRALGGRLCTACEEDITALARAPADSGTQWRCAACALALPEHDCPCPDCAERDTAFERTVVAFDYVPPADALVLQMKRARRYAQADLLGNLLAEAVRHAQVPLAADTVLVPTPASAASLRERGFSPAAEIARALGRDLRLPVRRDLVWRCREQPKQSSLQRLERMEAVQGLYACAPAVAGMRIGLVDDVMTTGSTLHEIASTLRAAGATSVIALVAGRTPHMFKNTPKNSRNREFFRK